MDANHLETKKNRTRCWERTNRLNQPNKIAKLSTRKKSTFHHFYLCLCILCHTFVCVYICRSFEKQKTSQVAGTDAPSTSTATTPRRHSGTPKERSASSASASASKVSRRSRSKSPFRSFRWKRGTSKAEVSDDEGGIENKPKKLCFYSLSHIIPKFSSNYGSVEPSLTVSLVHDLFVVS